MGGLLGGGAKGYVGPPLKLLGGLPPPPPLALLLPTPMPYPTPTQQFAFSACQNSSYIQSALEGKNLLGGDHTVELQWLEHLWDHENKFETGVVRANEC